MRGATFTYCFESPSVPSVRLSLMRVLVYFALQFSIFVPLFFYCPTPELEKVKKYLTRKKALVLG